MKVDNLGSLVKWAFEGSYERKLQAKEEICNFVFGDPQDMALEGLVKALEDKVHPKNPNWFAYKRNESNSVRIVSQSLQNRFKRPFEDADIFMTTGNIAGLGCIFSLLLNEGDETIYFIPPWFGYETMIVATGAHPVKLPVVPGTFDLDLEALKSSITPRTKAIIINSPNNPTGRIYSEDTLKKLGEILTQASNERGSPIWLISDEAYNKIIFDGNSFYSPTAYYPYSFLLYTYGKTLLAPGERIGYIALPPEMKKEIREQLRPIIMRIQVERGWVFPSTILQYALEDLEKLSIDLVQLQHKRDKMIQTLKKLGYEVTCLPEGTFYLFVKSPIEDDMKFATLLSEYNVFVLPGILLEAPGYFRISLTATEQMIDRSYTGFEAAKSRI